MVRKVTERVVVQAGGRIEIAASDLPVGAEAEVTVVVSEAPRPRPLSDYFGAAKGTYATPEEADCFIRALRDQWES